MSKQSNNHQVIGSMFVDDDDDRQPVQFPYGQFN